MNIIKKLILCCIFLVPALAKEDVPRLLDNPNKLAIFYTIEGNIEKQYNTLVGKTFKTIGFNLTDPHKRVNDQYKAKYGSTVLDVLSFMPIVNDKVILPLLNIDPRIAGFAPFNMLIHKKLDENVTHIGHLMPKVMLDILGIEDKVVREKFTATFKSLDSTIAKELNGTQSYTYYPKLPKQTMINFEYDFGEVEDIEDFVDEFQNKFELAFINKNYLIAGYHNFMDISDEAEDILSGYDAFWTYSLCHLEFSYNMFDNEGARPEAGLFAPCTMYMYIKKGTNTLVVGMFRLHNWSDTLNIKDKKRIALVEKLDREIPEILTDFGMKSTTNVNPLLVKKVETNTTTPTQKIEKIHPKIKKEISKIPALATLPPVPKPIVIPHSTTLDRSIKFSKRVPPNYIPHKFDHPKKVKSATHTNIGEVTQGRISAHLRGTLIDIKTAEENLKSGGFEILTSIPFSKDKSLVSIVFTHPILINMASKENRGFMASLRLLIDTKAKTISITNPLYMAKGFLQDDFDEKSAQEILTKLISIFPNLTNSKDALKFQLLPKYQFMNGMPYYQDMIEVASGDDLLERVKKHKNFLFSQTLENGDVLVGIKLERRTNKFTKRIGRNNAGMLPLPILISKGKAKILDPKYYIAYMYPMLQMSEFMTIATIPDAMTKDSKRVFKKKK